MQPDVGLVGRQSEQRRVGALLTAARNGHGGALRLSGEPGIGKTALLESVAARVGDAVTLRARGFEAEAGIPFGLLQRLTIPLRSHVDALPESRARVLRIACGEQDGDPPERYLVGLALLQLLTAAADAGPVVCLVDDAHLSDAESLDVLGFVARRLQADPVVVVLAGREANGLVERLAGIEAMTLEGLDPEAGRTLLTATLGEALDPSSAVRIVRATGGVPLALIDLAGELSSRRLAGLGLTDAPVPIGRHLEEHYLAQLHGVADDVQEWALVAAAESTGSPALVETAAKALGLTPEAADEAESAGLVRVDETVRFRHPLVRSAVYNAATGTRRRRAHRALAGAASELGLVEVEAWHASRAVVGHDGDVADRLEHAADLAARRGGLSSRATVLTRAAELTPPGPARGRRYVAAAEAALAVGAAGVSGDLLTRTTHRDTQPEVRGRKIMVESALALFSADRSVVRAPARLVEAADLFHDAGSAVEHAALLRAFEVCLVTERCAEGFTPEVLVDRLDAAGRGDGPLAPVLRGIGALVGRPYAQAVPPARAAVEAIGRLPATDMMHLGSVVVALTTFLWDEPRRALLLGRAARAAQETGALQSLDTLLWLMASTEVTGGTVRRATERLGQLREVRRSMGYDAEQIVDGGLLAWAGRRDAALAVADGAEAVGFGGVTSLARAAVATLDIADGRYGDGYERLLPLVDPPYLQGTATRYPDLVEAAVRSGHHEQATRFAQAFADLADANGSPWCRGLARRSLALVARPADAEELLRAALADLAATAAVIELGRTHLVLGEWLRRAKRRREAREQLTLAVARLREAGADIFVPRALAELEALGGAVVPAADDPLAALSPQELAVAKLASAGRTNAEIGDRLFISRNTVDYHLRKVFQRLGISSRRQLADVLADRRG